MADSASLEEISKRSKWYGDKAQAKRSTYIRLKGLQVVLAAAIPLISVAAASEWQRWANASMGALIGIIEGFLQLGQYQQNWLLYRATRESLKREELLHTAGVGPYATVANKDDLYVERCDAVMAGENSQWVLTQQQGKSNKPS